MRGANSITQQRKLRILTVGDGDLSLSLAIAKCYMSSNSNSSSSSSSSIVELTASTLLDSPQTLFATYPQTAPAILQQLEQVYQVQVLFGVDACFLHERFVVSSKNHHRDDTNNNTDDSLDDHIFDVVLFHHPHLGGSNSSNDKNNTCSTCSENEDASELDLIQRHSSLLAHYLHSAQQIAKTVHVALCCNQTVSWRLLEMANHVGLQLQRRIPVQHPFHQIFSPAVSHGICVSLFPWEIDPDWRPPIAAVEKQLQQQQHVPGRISRKQKSRHWLGRYGYQHVRTFYQGQSEAPNLSGSTHYVFQRKEQEDKKQDDHEVDEKPSRTTPSTTGSSISPLPPPPQPPPNTTAIGKPALTATTPITCSVCGIVFQDQAALDMHLTAPALPTCWIASSCCKTAERATSVDSLPSATAASTKQQPQSSTTRTHLCTPAIALHCESSQAAGGDNLTVALTVPGDCEGQRLRWFLQHCNVAANNSSDSNLLSKLSKRQWEGLIKSGGVSVNGVMAMDSGRILCSGWTVTVRTIPSNNDTSAKQVAKRGVVAVSLEKPVERNNSHHPIQVVAQDEYGDAAFCIVWKPVGMRTIGSFDACTLEETFTWQQLQTQLVHTGHIHSNATSTVKYKSLSKLDTGCSGLCVLQNVNYTNIRPTNSPLSIKVTHTFTILVHGSVPDEWRTPSGVSILLPTDGMRRWKRQKQKESTTCNHASEASSSPSLCAREVGCPASIRCLEQATLSSIPVLNHEVSTETTSSAPPAGERLSTVAITTDSQSSGLAQTIAHYLRKIAGRPVVGDRFAVSEYLSLPRSIRNRIKQRLCMGCTSVRVTTTRDSSSGGRTFNCEVPQRWSAAFWGGFCEAPTSS
jgi:hypothetical protein